MADNTCTWLGQIMKSRLLRKHLGEQVAIIWYIVWNHRLYLHYFTIYLHIIDMPTSCCVPQCNQQGFTTPTGEKVSYFSFPSLLLRRKQWIHAIRREEGKTSNFPQALQRSVRFIWDLRNFRKSLSGRIYVADGAIPSKFAWSIPSPRKIKAPTLRQPLVQTKNILKQDKLDANVTEEPISSVANDSELNTTDKELGYFKEGWLSNFTSWVLPQRCFRFE